MGTIHLLYLVGRPSSQLRLVHHTVAGGRFEQLGAIDYRRNAPWRLVVEFEAYRVDFCRGPDCSYCVHVTKQFANIVGVRVRQ